MEKIELGRVISIEDSPSTTFFSFVITGKVKKGQFVQIEEKNRILFGEIDEIYRWNSYLDRPDVVADYERSGGIPKHFPYEQGEYTVAKVRIAGSYIDGTYRRAYYPPSPGASVYLADEEILYNFIGFDNNGITIGNLQNHNLKANINVNRLFQKHLAILAMSGAGKSHLSTILIEELLDRKVPSLGIVAIDVHGEYLGFKKDPNYRDKTTIINGKDIKMTFDRAPSLALAEFLGLNTKPQRMLLKELRKEVKRKRDQGEIIRKEQLKEIVEKLSGEKKTKENLLKKLYLINTINFIGEIEKPKIHTLVKPNHLTIIDLSDIDNSIHKQTLVAYIGERLFSLRRKNKIPPFLFLVEEAHNFATEGKEEKNISRGIIEKIAREGRKFGACLSLITQRPSHISNTALSQCNTHIILRVMNPNDLKKISESSEGIDKSRLNAISSLRVGEALLVGEAVNFPTFIDVRDRRSKRYDEKGKGLEEQVKEYLSKEKEIEDQVEAYTI